MVRERLRRTPERIASVSQTQPGELLGAMAGVRTRAAAGRPKAAALRAWRPQRCPSLAIPPPSSSSEAAGAPAPGMPAAAATEQAICNSAWAEPCRQGVLGNRRPSRRRAQPPAPLRRSPSHSTHSAPATRRRRTPCVRAARTVARRPPRRPQDELALAAAVAAASTMAGIQQHHHTARVRKRGCASQHAARSSRRHEGRRVVLGSLRFSCFFEYTTRSKWP